MYQGTKNEISSEEFDQKYHWMMKNGFQIQFIRESDIKFRFSTDKWMFFYQNVFLIEEVLNKTPQLKELIYGPENMDFKFDRTFLQAKTELNQYHARQISRTEANENIEFDSNWTLFWEVFEYALAEKKDSNEEPREPLQDADRL